MLDKRKFYINGKWVDPVEKNDFEVINPCNEDPCAIISLGSKKDTDNAVKALTALSVSFFEPNEIIAQGSSLQGLITSKSFFSTGSTHFPFM